MQNIVNCAVQRLVAVVEVLQWSRGITFVEDLPEPTAKTLQNGLVLQHCVGNQSRQTDIIAADRDQQQIDFSRMFAWTFVTKVGALTVKSAAWTGEVAPAISAVAKAWRPAVRPVYNP